MGPSVNPHGAAAVGRAPPLPLAAFPEPSQVPRPRTSGPSLPDPQLPFFFFLNFLKMS